MNADGWVEAKVEFDYDRGIPKKIPAATPDAKALLHESLDDSPRIGIIPCAIAR